MGGHIWYSPSTNDSPLAIYPIQSFHMSIWMKVVGGEVKLHMSYGINNVLYLVIYFSNFRNMVFYFFDFINLIFYFVILET